MAENRKQAFGADSEYGVLREVLLGKPDYYRWVEAGPIIRRTFENADRTGAKFDFATATAQHREMVSIYESAGVKCHFLDSDEVLHRNFFARDSSAMTPWGPVICHMQLKCRRADYVTAISFLSERRHPDMASLHRRPFRGRRSGSGRARCRVGRLRRATQRA